MTRRRDRPGRVSARGEGAPNAGALTSPRAGATIGTARPGPAGPARARPSRERSLAPAARARLRGPGPGPAH